MAGPGTPSGSPGPSAPTSRTASPEPPYAWAPGPPPPAELLAAAAAEADAPEAAALAAQPAAAPPASAVPARLRKGTVLRSPSSRRLPATEAAGEGGEGEGAAKHVQWGAGVHSPRPHHASGPGLGTGPASGPSRYAQLPTGVSASGGAGGLRRSSSGAFSTDLSQPSAGGRGTHAPSPGSETSGSGWAAGEDQDSGAEATGGGGEASGDERAATGSAAGVPPPQLPPLPYAAAVGRTRRRRTRRRSPGDDLPSVEVTTAAGTLGRVRASTTGDGPGGAFPGGATAAAPGQPGGRDVADLLRGEAGQPSYLEPEFYELVARVDEPADVQVGLLVCVIVG